MKMPKVITGRSQTLLCSILMKKQHHAVELYASRRDWTACQDHEEDKLIKVYYVTNIYDLRYEVKIHLSK